MLLLRENRPQSAAAILRALGEVTAACAIAPELYWEVLHDASARRAQADARFLPLFQTMPGKHAARRRLPRPSHPPKRPQKTRQRSIRLSAAAIFAFRRRRTR